MNKTLFFLLTALIALCYPKTQSNSNYIEKIIPTFNTLQEIISKANLANSLDFPQLVVVGAQSTGKSSVLEGIIRKDFLPRGTGIVTRTPIVIQMINTAGGTAEYAVVGTKTISDWKMVKKEIEIMTESLTDGTKGISTVPINIKIFSPNVVNLNIVDLPGITKIPVQGQPNDIGDRIYEMVMSYIKNPNSIILAVTPATIDLANSDSLKLARDVDPHGLRTVGVITKLDLMDKGTNYLPALKGNIHKLKLGYVGLVCRGQRDLEEGKSIEHAILEEKRFFEGHPDYKNYADEMGVEYLTKMLSRIFLQHIKDNLPKLKTNIGLLIEDVKTRIAQYGNPIHESSKGVFILSILNRFVDAYSQTIEGRDPIVNGETRLVGGARISLIFNEGFKNVVYGFDPFEGFDDDKIQTEIINSKALHPDIFITGSISEKFLKNQILKLQGVAIQCAKLVQKELQDIVHTILTDNKFSENFRFKTLNTQISKIINDVLKDALNETTNAINILFKIEQGFINIKHPDFMKAMEKLSTSVQSDIENYKDPEQEGGIFSALKNLFKKDMKNSQTNMSEVCNRDTGDCQGNAYLEPLPQNIYVRSKNHKNDISIVKRFVNSYFDIVKKNLADSVPKAIVTFLVNESIETSKNKLMTEILSQSQKYDQVLKEDTSVVEKRRAYQDKLTVLEKSEELLLEMGSQLLIN